MSLGALLAERARRQAQAAVTADRQARYDVIAAELRSWYHPKQAAFLRSKAKRRAALCTRRSGKTAGVCREYVARALEHPGWGGMYVNEVREEAKQLAWRSRTKQGMADLIDAMILEGKLKRAEDRGDLARGADVKIDETALTLEFANGSLIRIFAADDTRSQDRARGTALHVVTVDECQKYPNAREFVEQVIGPATKDFRGEIWLTGTPFEVLAGLFYDVTANDNAEAIEKREKGWEVHEWSVLDNPWFGATPEERWEEAIGSELRDKGIDPSDPPGWVLREWRAQWTREGALVVYSVHRWPDTPAKPLLYADLRTQPITPDWLRQVNPEGKDPSGVSGYIDRWYDHAASVRDLPLLLPGTTTRIDWFFGLGVDFGYNPHPFAVSMWAFSPSWPDLLEMFSWKRTLVLPDYQRDCVRWFFLNVPGLLYLDGDPGGLQGAHLEGWRQLLQLPIENADKAAKRTWQEMLNNDGERGRIRFRRGSVMFHEMRYLTFTMRGKKLEENQDRELPDKTVPGSDCVDGGLYAYRRYINRRLDEPTPPPVHGSPEWYAEEERKMRAAASAAAREAIAAEVQAGDDGYGEEYGDY